MNEREQTIQQLDPIGTVGMRRLTIVISACVLAYTSVTSVINRDEIESPELAVSSIAIIVLSSLVVFVAAGPHRAAVSRNAFMLAISTAFFGYSLAVAATWHSPTVVGAWGPLAVGFVIVGFAAYRPFVEIALAGVFSATFAGFMIVVQAGRLSNPLPVFVLVIIATAPLVMLSAGAASLSGTVTRAVVEWNSRAADATDRLERQLHGGIARSVQQDRVTILNRDVVPFFTGLIDRGTIDDADRARAREIADSIRMVMVAEVDRTWLDEVVESAGEATLGSRAPGAEAVSDPERLAGQMTRYQRTVIRALIAALFTHPAFDPDGFDVSIGRRGQSRELCIRSAFLVGESVIRQDLEPYLAVLRIVFPEFNVTWARRTSTMKFSYAGR